MNHLNRRQLVIEYYVWEPFEKHVQADEDHILHMLKERKLLPHAGYQKCTFKDLPVEVVNEQA